MWPGRKARAVAAHVEDWEIDDVVAKLSVTELVQNLRRSKLYMGPAAQTSASD